jgi:hypothetical protein
MVVDEKRVEEAMKLVDVNGDRIEAGDTIAIAMSAGRGAVLNVYEILEICRPRNEDSYYLEIPVKARVVQSRHYGRQSGTVSTLHGDLFKDRALVLKKGK